MLFLSAGNIHRAFGSKSHRPTCAGALRVVPASGVALPRRLLRDHRLAAVRPVRERVHDPDARAFARGALRASARGVPGAAAGRVRRDGRDGARGRAGRSARSARDATPYRDGWLGVAPIALLLALVLCLGLWIPAPLARAPARGRGARGGARDERRLHELAPRAERRGDRRERRAARCRSPSSGLRSSRSRGAASASRRSSARRARGRRVARRRARGRPATARSGSARERATRVATFPSLTPELPAGPPVRARDRRAVRLRPEGHPWLKPVRFQPPREPGSARAPIGDHGLLPRRGRRGARGRGRARCTPASSSRATSASSATASTCSTSRSRSATSTAASSARSSGGPRRARLHYVETLAGDTTIGHATAYCQALEALAELPRRRARAGAARHRARARAPGEPHRRPRRAGRRRRLPADRGLLRPAARRLPEPDGRALRQPLRARPGPPGRRRLRRRRGARSAACSSALDAAVRDVERRGRPALGHALGDGALRGHRAASPRSTAEELGLVGPGRARLRPARATSATTHPSGIFRFAHVPVVDLAHRRRVRARLRALARDRSARSTSCASSSRSLPRGRAARAAAARSRPTSSCVALVEGWRGEICHVALTDAAGRFARYKIVDPSFHNWIGLALALRGQQISDFPLCNKSFNLSYCGYDL